MRPIMQGHIRIECLRILCVFNIKVMLNLFKLLFGWFYKLYRDYNGIYSYLYFPIRFLAKQISCMLLPLFLKSSHRQKLQYTESELIVSFTSFPARIMNVWKVVDSLKNQTIIPKKIILWLSRDQFPSKAEIPYSLLRQEDDLFEIRIVNGDIRSHKKYYYAMKEFPEKVIITCDDDVYYYPDMIRYLLDGYALYPSCIISNITKQIVYDEDGNLLPYIRWKRNKRSYAHEELIQIGVGGVLYPPFCLDNEVLNNQLFMDLCPLADDVWLNFMARMKGTKIIQSNMKILPLPIKSDTSSLSSVNMFKGMNDKQIDKLRSYFFARGKDAYKIHFV